MKSSERIRKYQQRYDPVFRAAREWKNDDVASIVYMIIDGVLNINVDTNHTLSLLDDWDAEDCMDIKSTFHKRKYYFLKSQIHNHDTPTDIETFSGENTEEYFKVMDDKTQSLIIRDTQDIFLRKLVADNNVLPGTWYFK